MHSQSVSFPGLESPKSGHGIAGSVTDVAQTGDAIPALSEPSRSSVCDQCAHDSYCLTYAIIKRVLDVVLSFFLLLSITPLLLVIALAVKLSSPGPVLFKQERVGKGGKTFTILKFRTMRVANKTLTDRLWCGTGDLRQTRVGALLRRTNLDELPQFFNVLCGTMSIVGPRPERPYFVEKFAKEIPNYKARHSGEVGITGWAQVHGYRGDTCIKTRLGYDLEYLRNRSLHLDIKIIWLTVIGCFFNACPNVRAVVVPFPDPSYAGQDSADMRKAA
jgi:lipopolysaccharide/colanic/teichoic acid biosynthesis glycosyltransferase